MKLTEAQAQAIRKLRAKGIAAGAVINIGALGLDEIPSRSRGLRRALKNLAEKEQGFRRQGARGLWVVLPELYAALDAHDRSAA